MRLHLSGACIVKHTWQAPSSGTSRLMRRSAVNRVSVVTCRGAPCTRRSLTSCMRGRSWCSVGFAFCVMSHSPQQASTALVACDNMEATCAAGEQRLKGIARGRQQMRRHDEPLPCPPVLDDVAAIKEAGRLEAYAAQWDVRRSQPGTSLSRFLCLCAPGRAHRQGQHQVHTLPAHDRPPLPAAQYELASAWVWS